MKTRLWVGAGIILSTLMTLLAAPILSGPARAQSYDTMGCDQLWYARNAIYAAKGYCFTTDRARSVFGPGCFPPYGQLTQAEANRVETIKQWEGYRGCGVAAAPPPPPPPPVQYARMSCDELWYARNSIYAAKGYCFKSERALSVFGPRCFAPYGKLTGAEQSQVNAIQQWERSKGCR